MFSDVLGVVAALARREFQKMQLIRRSNIGSHLSTWCNDPKPIMNQYARTRLKSESLSKHANKSRTNMCAAWNLWFPIDRKSIDKKWYEQSLIPYQSCFRLLAVRASPFSETLPKIILNNNMFSSIKNIVSTIIMRWTRRVLPKLPVKWVSKRQDHLIFHFCA